MVEQLKLSPETRHIVDEILSAMEKELDMERAAVMADTRYRFIERMLADCVVLGADEQGSMSDRIDSVLTHRVLAIPVFLLMMLLVFYITFGPLGSFLADGFAALVQGGIELIAAALVSWGVADWVRDLLVNGVLTGVGSVLSFMPTILILFLLLSILEDSGYMARAAFLMDKPLRKIGLNGRAFIPMMMGLWLYRARRDECAQHEYPARPPLYHYAHAVYELRREGADLRAVYAGRSSAAIRCW